MDPISAAIMGTAMVAGGGMSLAGMNASNKATRGFTREMFKKQVALDNTAVQRRRADMQAAGFNPLLAATGGQAAHTPSSSASTMGNAGKAFADQIRPEMILDIQQGRANIAKTKAETLVSEETAKNLEETNKNIAADTMVKQWNAAKIEAELSGTSVVEAGIKLFGSEFKYQSKSYNNQVPNAAASASQDAPVREAVSRGTSQAVDVLFHGSKK